MHDIAPEDRLLTPAEVAALFKVTPGAVGHWERLGKISAVRTLGGHRRFRESEVRALLVTGVPRKPRKRKPRAGGKAAG